MPFSDREWPRYVLRDGDILLNEGQSLDLVGRAAIYRGHPPDCAFQNTLVRFQAGPRTDQDFALALFRFFHAAGHFAEIATQTTSIAHLGSGRFGALEVALPPLPEQRKIAAILSSVDEAIEGTQAVIDQLQVVKKAMMADLLTRGIPGRHKKFKQTEIGEVPEEWEIVPLSELASIERGKFSHRPRNDPRFYGGEYPFVQTGDVASSGGRIKHYSQSLNREGLGVSRLFPAGTIVITIAANIGDTGIAMFPVAFPDSLVGIQTGSRVENRFLELVLRARKKSLEDSAPQNAQKNINLETLRPLLIQLPSPHEQQHIADVFDNLDDRLNREMEVEARLGELKSALMSVLLTGEVRVHVDEESAA
jgi:type I restriction enzyme S subunit